MRENAVVSEDARRALSQARRGTTIVANSKRMLAPLAHVLENRELLVRVEREAGKLAGRFDACLEKRDRLLERAERKLDPWQPVVELGRRYVRWQRGAERAQEAGREFLGNER